MTKCQNWPKLELLVIFSWGASGPLKQLHGRQQKFVSEQGQPNIAVEFVPKTSNLTRSLCVSMIFLVCLGEIVKAVARPAFVPWHVLVLYQRKAVDRNFGRFSVRKVLPVCFSLSSLLQFVTLHVRLDCTSVWCTKGIESLHVRGVVRIRGKPSQYPCLPRLRCQASK